MPVPAGINRVAAAWFLLACWLIGAAPALAAQPAAPHPLVADPQAALHGAGSARGAVIWSHGIGARDMSKEPTPSVVRALADSGWDIYRYDRAPRQFRGFGAGFEPDEAGLVEGASALHDAGYGRVLLAGHSYGAWLSLAALDRLDFVYGLLAIAPARHGQVAFSPERSLAALADFRASLTGIRSHGVRLAFMFFPDDAYDPGPSDRAAAAAQLAPTVGAPLLTVTDDPDLRDHDAGLSGLAGQRYGGCIAAFFAERAERCPTPH